MQEGRQFIYNSITYTILYVYENKENCICRGDGENLLFTKSEINNLLNNKPLIGEDWMD